jgi:hypothetical protein
MLQPLRVDRPAQHRGRDSELAQPGRAAVGRGAGAGQQLHRLGQFGDAAGADAAGGAFQGVRGAVPGLVVGRRGELGP